MNKPSKEQLAGQVIKKLSATQVVLVIALLLGTYVAYNYFGKEEVPEVPATPSINITSNNNQESNQTTE